MPISLVIPAHDEETVIGRCLEAALDGAAPDELDVVVVCNGCSDGTADAARRFGGRVRVVETPTASKVHALNLGDQHARGFPRVYLDADVVLPLASIRRIARALDAGALAAAPEMTVDLSRSTWPVRAFYAVWTRTPYVREGMIGVGVYALSEEGRRRFGAFPDLIADDGFVRMLFTPEERVRVEGAPVTVVPPATLFDLVRVKTRSRLGGYQLASRRPDLVRKERKTKDYGGALSSVLRDPRLWPHAAVYFGIVLWVRLRARRMQRRAQYAWERDASSRQAVPTL